MKVCITGATGFIGKNLLNSLKEREGIELIALSRKISEHLNNAKKDNVTWRRCNGFSMIDVEEATKDADIIVYLIHSMVPTSTLSQGVFSDFDLYLADNFAKAAKKNNVKKIIYLSGLIPEKDKLSAHLLSRLEVEKTLSQYGNDLTVLRAGLVVGKNGSSFKILEKLIKRLPVLVCPAWTNSKSQPIDLADVIKSINYCIDHSDELNSVYDVGGPDQISYKEMLRLTSEALGKKRKILDVPFFSPSLSKFWVANVTSSPKNLVYPLVESLRHEMLCRDDFRLKIKGHEYIGFKESLVKGLSLKDDGFIRFVMDYNAKVNLRWMENVSSVQRIKVKKEMSGDKAADMYFAWLPKFLRPFINVKESADEVVSFYFAWKVELLRLQKSETRSDKNRVVYYIKGGVLARRTSYNGRLEFRWIESSNCLIVGLLDYRPSLPWFIYKITQAQLHLFVMNKFRKHLRRKS